MPLITTFYAGLLGLLALSLAWLVVTNRRRAQVGLGSGGDAALERAIRSGKPYVLDVIIDRDAGVPFTGGWAMPPVPIGKPAFGKPK